MVATDCGTQHLKLASLIVGIVLTVCCATIVYARVAIAEIDARVRIVEQSSAANAARFEAIRDSLQRLEARP